MKVLVVISGQSASGKTHVSEHVKNQLAGAQILNMDDYYLPRPPGTIDIEKYRRETNFDRPEMMDFKLFQEHIIALNQGKSITKHIFDFPTNSRVATEVINPSEVIIIEGIFAQYFYDNFVPLELPSVTVSVATEDYKDILQRRIDRDVKHRGRKKEDVLSQEKKFVGPGFLKYTAPHAHADIYINNIKKNTPAEQTAVFQKAAAEIKTEIDKKIAEVDNGSFRPRKSRPNVQEIVARSHLLAAIRAGKNENPERFYNGVFGESTGNHQHQFTKKEINKLILRVDLEKYIERIEKHKENNCNHINFKHNFWFFKNSRALSREANYYLAKKLLTTLIENEGLPIEKIFSNTLQRRAEIISQKGINNRPDYAERKINSSELSAIISKANKFIAMSAEEETQHTRGATPHCGF